MLFLYILRMKQSQPAIVVIMCKLYFLCCEHSVFQDTLDTNKKNCQWTIRHAFPYGVENNTHFTIFYLWFGRNAWFYLLAFGLSDMLKTCEIDIFWYLKYCFFSKLPIFIISFAQQTIIVSIFSVQFQNTFIWGTYLYGALHVITRPRSFNDFEWTTYIEHGTDIEYALNQNQYEKDNFAQISLNGIAILLFWQIVGVSN